MKELCSLGIPLRTLQLFAPAVRIDDFVKHALPAIQSGRCPKATMYVLNEEQELDDTVGPYGRSLLWLVSNAFEDERGTPLLGMKHYIKSNPGLINSAFAQVIESVGQQAINPPCASETHGGFDNDPATMNAVLSRILGRKPQPEFDQRDLDY